MNNFHVLLALMGICASLASALSVRDEFTLFKAKHGKSYANSDLEAAALRNFEANLRRIEAMKAENPLAEFGITRFADLSREQFRAISHGAKPKISQQRSSPVLQSINVPSVVNWVSAGAVTPVVDQGECGSDWAFAAVANIEGVNFVTNKVLTPLSVEELLDCDTLAQGCDGGFMVDAYEWLIQKQGGNIMTEASWPYTSGTSNCTYVGKTVGATLTSYKEIAHDEADMTYYTATVGPIATAVDADSWQFYTSGVLTSCNATDVDHGVAVVGYNDVASPNYWILKNTWGADWGMSGYIYIQKGINACGVTSYPVTAYVQKY